MTSTSPKFTSQQLDFIQACQNNPSQSYVLEALAGTGKTTTLLYAAPDHPTLALAFNKKIQEELSSRFPSNVECKTLNGLGHKAVMKMLGGYPEIDKSKLYTLVCQALNHSELDAKTARKLFPDIMNLTKSARQAGILHSARYNAIPLLQDTNENWEDLCDEYDLDERAIPTARQALKLCVEAALKGHIDFQDQLYLPVVFRAPLPKNQYQTIILDEAQDLGPLEHKMVELCMGGRLIAAGDSRQSLYQWKGAFTDSMNRLLDKTNAISMPLTVTWRCPKAVVREAQHIVPSYEAAPDASEGSVAYWNNWTPKDIKPGKDTAILCRRNKPLFAVAMSLLQNKIPCHIEGRDIGIGLNKIINQLASKNEPSDKLIAAIDNWRQQKEEKLHRDGKKAKIPKIRDQADSIIAVATSVSTVRETTRKIDDLFGKNISALTLSTVHKAKGKEWRHVYILGQIGSRDNEYSSSSSLEEENIQYVAITRALESLEYLEYNI